MTLDPRGHILGQQDFREGHAKHSRRERQMSGSRVELLECLKCIKNTLPETNIAPENGWLEY